MPHPLSQKHPIPISQLCLVNTDVPAGVGAPPLDTTTQTASPTPHDTHSPPSTSIPIDQAPTTNVSQASPTTGVPTNSQASPPELCPSDQDEYSLKTGSKESRTFTRYNYNNLHKQRPNKVKKTKITV